ncbi:MAG: hypothetical protein AB2689_04025 [Candidatus Thiodiazotropha taylori]
MTRHKHLDDLANELFHVFSRTEYSLKAAGFNNGDGAAEANWRKFALVVEGFVAAPTSQQLKEAIDFVLSEPPKKQVIRHGVIEWEVSEPTTDSQADKLLIYVRRVRNNLFHGGKFNGHWFAPERSEALLKNSLIILSSLVESVADVREAYHG